MKEFLAQSQSTKQKEMKMVISAAFLIAIFAGFTSMSSGTIDMQDFYGSSAESSVFVDSGSIRAFASSTSRDNAQAIITYRSNGTVDSEALPPGLPPDNFDNWLISGSAEFFEIRATVINGETPVGGVGVWHSLSSDVSWSVSTGGGGRIRYCIYDNKCTDKNRWRPYTELRYHILICQEILKTIIGVNVSGAIAEQESKLLKVIDYVDPVFRLR